MGAVKTNHKRHEQIRRLDKACRQWGREDQAIEAAEVRRHNRAVKAHKMKRLYPNSIAPERLNKIINNALKLMTPTLTQEIGIYNMTDWHALGGLVKRGDVTVKHHFPWICGIDLASGKDHTGYGGRIE